ncbi:Wzz/FepE/Etk N-terminal domain-containing protein [Aquirufa sp.]|jgi:uncharacterized protein involved in exopolysaccharide biosynthesis|uniref:Wzz/FepE/Etk N-terminal domain-containing protein n=1 Tax=Aquirufa sp. TaxID=2676249 RepID=UPI003783B01D
MSNIENKQIEDNGEISINFGEIFRTLKSYRILIATCAVLFAALGAIYSLTQPNEYSSNAKLLPELDSKSGGAGGMGGLKSLAGLAGVDLGGSSSGAEAIRPDLYPNIVQSAPLLQEVLKAKIYSTKHKKWQTVLDFLSEKQDTAPLDLGGDPSDDEVSDVKLDKVPSGALSTDLIKLNKKERLAIKKLRASVVLEIDKKSGVISLTTKLTNPVAAANITSLIQHYLTKYVTDYRTQKARQELSFLEKRLSESRARYDQALFTLSAYRDQNMNLFMNVAKDREKKLQYEVDMAYNLYTTISGQYEESKVKLHRETPVFKVLEPAQVAVQKDGPKRSLITIGFMFVGVFASLIYVFFKTVNLKELLG